MKPLETIRKTYTTFAVVAFTAVLLLSLAIISLLLYESSKKIQISGANPRIYNRMIARDINALHKVYPTMKDGEIRKLLYETWTRPYLYEPFTQFQERPYSGKYVRVDPNGFREVAHQQPWPPLKSNYNIFVLGGSTVFGYGVTDKGTIASYLGEYLSNLSGAKPVAVYNFGRGFYYSTQERILYEQLLAEGYAPDLAIFVDGLNEFYHSSNQPILTQALRGFINKPVRKTMFTQVIDDLEQRSIATYKWIIKRSALKDIVYESSAMKERVVENYLQNIRIISAVSAAYTVLPLFVWQPIPAYRYDLKYHVFDDKKYGGHHLASRSGYQYMAESVRENPPEGCFLWLADIQEGIQKPLYVDKVHYTAEFSSRIANEIGDYISEQGLMSASSEPCQSTQ